ncbi:MAG: MGMT family protein [candidate division Zixibacteria bacterium]|nr:MGMT family protein [candidate division Zixibacteria bacterium]
MTSSFHQKAIAAILKIPLGKVATYGQIALLAGSSRGARQVVRVLHSSSKKASLPWYRVVNREGRISLGRGQGYELQKALLVDEGVEFRLNGSIDLNEYQWTP